MQKDRDSITKSRVDEAIRDNFDIELNVQGILILQAGQKLVEMSSPEYHLSDLGKKRAEEITNSVGGYEFIENVKESYVHEDKYREILREKSYVVDDLVEKEKELLKMKYNPDKISPISKTNRNRIFTI